MRRPPRSTLFPYPTLFRSRSASRTITSDRSSSVRHWPASTCTCALWSSCAAISATIAATSRSEEHTSELQSRQYLVCRLLLEKKEYRLPRTEEHTSQIHSR